eukprot:gb/GECH01011150.1/.p1 GENE.gb/GECH01011150.1/~~gb/GECH01011150.1/.p1  ORF type:complete len:145 (+),score=39.13 gb/GECH01011150.1/:1-435(+)
MHNENEISLSFFQYLNHFSLSSIASSTENNYRENFDIPIDDFNDSEVLDIENENISPMINNNLDNTALTHPSPSQAPSFQYSCEICGCNEYRDNTVIASSSIWSKLLNIQTRKFATVSCQNCGHTEFFERYQSPIWNILDILIR